MIPSKTAASRLLVPGHIIGSSDGQPWLIISSLNTKDGTACKLADLTGSPISTPSNFDPVPFRIARIATLIRLAYNKDFDEYVKSSIRAAGLPVDPAMNWAKYLYKVIGSKLPTHDEDIIDEAVHEIIIRVMITRKALDPDNPSGFQQTIGRFGQNNPEVQSAIQALPLEKQVSEFLKKSFTFRLDETIKYVQRILQGQAPGEEEDETNPLLSLEPEDDEGGSILNTQEQGTGLTDFHHTEENIDLGDYRGRQKNNTTGTFTEGLKAWLLEDKLKRKYRSPVVRQYMRLLTLLHDETKSVGKMPKLDDIERQWKKLQDRHEGSHNRLDHDGFVKLFKNLPIIIEIYVRTHYHGQESTLPALIRVLNRIGAEKRQKQLENSNKDRGSRIESEEPSQEATLEDAPLTNEEASRDLPPESHVSSQKQQWEVPACKGCGNINEPERCKGCQEWFCQECLLNHHSNFPSHDGVL